MESTSAILWGRYTSHSSIFAQPQHGARTLPSSGMYPRECPFPASYQLPGPCGCALCQLPYPYMTFEQTSDIRTPASSAVCTRFGTRRGFGTRMHLPRIWNSKRHVGPTCWRTRQEDGSKPAPAAPVDAANRLVSPRFAIWQSSGGQVRARVINDFSVSQINQSVDASDTYRPESLDALASLARLQHQPNHPSHSALGRSTLLTRDVVKRKRLLTFGRAGKPEFSRP